jgi:hypothetical protein
MDLSTQIAAKREFGELICQQLTKCIDQIGFSAGVISSYPDYQAARFEWVKDPAVGEFNLCGYWYDQRGQRIGRLQFQSDDSCYAEYDVVQNHPLKKQWFVENVIAWGKVDALKTEPTLLRLPDDNL